MGRKILVVEDDHNISDLIHMYLVKEGFDVRIAGDGGKAIEEFQKEVPDLILLDIMLPVMDGWAVCAKIRETSKVPIIMLTAKSEVFDRIQGLEMGADDYIVKPFEMKELIARINAVLRRTEIPNDTANTSPTTSPLVGFTAGTPTTNRLFSYRPPRSSRAEVSPCSIISRVIFAGMVTVMPVRSLSVESSTWPSRSQIIKCTSDTVAAKEASCRKSRSFCSSSIVRKRPLSR